jgi:hypothetical protein
MPAVEALCALPACSSVCAWCWIACSITQALNRFLACLPLPCAVRDARRWMGETVSSSDEEDLDWGEEAALPPRTAPGSPDGSSDHPGPSHAGAAGDELPPNPGACPGPFQAVPMVVDEEGVVRPLHEELRKCGEFLSGLNAEHPLPQPPPPGAANSAAFKQALRLVCIRQG